MLFITPVSYTHLQMSAWYIFSAMGFYPVNPSDGKYQLGTPLFKKVTIKLGQDRKFVIQANRETDRYIYVKEVFLAVYKRQSVT